MSDKLRRYATHAIIATALLVGVVLGYPEIIEAWTQTAPRYDPGIPTSFSGNRLAYGFALFSLFSVSVLTVRQLIIIAAQLREESWRQDPDVGLYRMTLAACMLALLLGAAPDVILLLLWGEAGQRTMTSVMTFDRVCDGLVIAPFIAATMLRVRADQFRRTPSLAELNHIAPEVDVKPRDRGLFVVSPRAETIWENSKIVGIVMAIAAGVALWK